MRHLMLATVLLSVPVPVFAQTANGQVANGLSEAPPAPEVAVRAMPRGDATTWLSPADYPSDALRNKEQGLVRATLQIGIDGHISGCAISVSSGSRTLDLATCSILRRRARFMAAAQANGDPALDRWVYSYSWVLPKP